MKSLSRALALLVLAAILAPLDASAAEPERVVVRNRKFTADGKLEAAANVSFGLVSYLTSHTNFTASLSYNVVETLALQLEGGWAYSKQTNVARAASQTMIRDMPDADSTNTIDDFADLWQMQWNVTGAVRWAPLYGKINIAAELPVHFQVYLLLGGGAGGFSRDSLVYCMGDRNPGSAEAASCAAQPDASHNELKALRDEAIKPVILAGFGFRFFVTQWAGLKVEVRDMAFPDSYRVGINRYAAENDSAAIEGGDAKAVSGKHAGSPGFTNLVFAQVGAVFTF